MGRNLTASWTTGWVTHFIPTVLTSGAAFTANEMAFEASTEPGQKVNQPFHVGIDAGRIWGTEHVGTEFAPTHVQLPAILYLGLSARVLGLTPAFPSLDGGRRWPSRDIQRAGIA